MRLSQRWIAVTTSTVVGNLWRCCLGQWQVLWTPTVIWARGLSCFSCVSVCSGVNEVNKFFVYFCFLHKKKATNITKYWRNAELMGTASSGVTVRLVSFGVSLPVAVSRSRSFSVSCCLLTSPNWHGKHTHTHRNTCTHTVKWSVAS